MIDYEAEIERLLSGPPSKLAFRALCAAVGRSGSPHDLVPRCAERLASWPDAVREAPWSWLAALDAGHSKPTWPLVRSLALRSTHNGTLDPALPDPRSQPEVRGVTHLDLGWFASDHLAALVETMGHWDDLRAIETGGLTDMDDELLAKLAGNPAITRIESLNLVTARENMWHFEKPPFRPPAGQPWRLRHAGLRAPDLVHLIRSGLVPHLRSADVLVCGVDEAQELADCPELARLDRLAIGFRCGRNGRQPLWKPYFGNVIDEDDDAGEAFFARADLAGLRDLTVRGTTMGLGREGLGARGVDAVVASGVLRQLTELTLELLPVGDPTIARVLEAVDHDHIEELTLADLVATDVTAAAFVATEAFPRLRRLDLSRNRLGANGARQLATDVRLPALEHLDLKGRKGGSPYYGCPSVQPVGDTGAEAWASSDNAAKLTYLNMAATGLGQDGLIALMRSERLLGLGFLDVSHNPVGSWPAALRKASVWRTLRTLDVTECGLGDDDVESLASTPSAPPLHGISLAYNSVGSRGARALASWAVLPQLWELNLHDNVIGDDGLADLATSRAAQRLLELDLEQDCWNAHARKYGAPLPVEVLDQASFPSLDAVFLGIVDEYHGARYSSGFPTRIREDIASASATRPELVAFLTHLDMEELEDIDTDEGDGDGADRDFRGNAARHYEFVDEAADFARRMIEGDIGWPPPTS
ncbi:hypothetical protein FKR81_02295 [Lentzea tibetensis]|uniref:Uncharacterized protein n=1 Tax=Lentzea tibetensis TaxID=2591470 RepID=A0A563F1K0_9PSEU|nr:hypothetical protein [Lentzea tibetensis]TWP53618.1 hypothetical protein FKR81_02295 [Lentzea tibetensis]